jgi:hypothetical protein
MNQELIKDLRELLFAFRHYKRMTDKSLWSKNQYKIDMNEFLEWLDSFRA